MPDFTKKVETEKIDILSCIGSVSFKNYTGAVDVKESQSGSGYFMCRLYATPDERFGGVPASRNVMIQPEWTDPDFDPNDLKLDLLTVSRARSRRKNSREEDLDDQTRAILRTASMWTVYSMTIYNEKRGDAILQVLLGDSFEEWSKAVDGMDPEEFFNFTADAVEAATKDAILIYEAKQSTDQEGELTEYLEITRLWRIGSQKDLEDYLNGVGRRKVELLWDPQQIIG